MERIVLSWNPALEQGYEPRLYPFNPEDILAGVYNARLGFKIWAKKTMTIVCYFEVADISKKCCLFVSRITGDKQYMLPSGNIDFTRCPIEQLYLISITYNWNDRPVLKEAILV